MVRSLLRLKLVFFELTHNVETACTHHDLEHMGLVEELGTPAIEYYQLSTVGYCGSQKQIHTFCKTEPIMLTFPQIELHKKKT